MPGRSLRGTRGGWIVFGLSVVTTGVTASACSSSKPQAPGAGSSDPLVAASALAVAAPELAQRLAPVAWSDGWQPEAGRFTSAGGRGEHTWDELAARMPARADEALEVGPSAFPASKLALTAVGATPSAGHLEGGHLVYPGAYGSDVDLLVTSDRASMEELFLLRNERAAATFSWRVALPRGVVASVKRDGSLSFEGPRGDALVHVPRPYAVDAAGATREARLAWDAGLSLLSVELDPKGLVFPVLLDPAFEVAAWQPTAATPPSRRGFHKMVYDEARGNIVLFGGYDGFFLSDTWLYDGVAWTDVTPAVSPPYREVHGMAYDAARREVVLFGGDMGLVGGVPTARGDTWIWDGTAWTEREPATSPSPRMYVTMVYDAARANVVMFGGFSGAAHLGDTWTWDGTNWTVRTPANAPTIRSAHAMEYDAARGKVLLFGGNDSTSQKNQTYSWDGVTWTQLAPAASPSARSYHTLTYDPARKAVVLFGGQSGSTLLNDTWTWNGSTWAQLTAATRPATRRDHAAAYFGGRVVVTGGRTTGNAILQDSWEYHAKGGACVTGADCATGSCVDGVCCESASCGTCEACDVAGSVGVCTPVVGAPDPDTCLGVCSASGACQAAAGASCTDSAQCATGSCVDGVCCNTTCEGQCEACDLPASKGTCTANVGAPRGARAACAGGGAGVCGTSTCDGSSRTACAALPGPAVTCRPGSCKDGVATTPGGCDGKGACGPSTTAPCAPYVCDAEACKTTCSAASDCAAGFRCDANKCVAQATPAPSTPTPPPTPPGTQGPSQTCVDSRTLRGADGKITECAPYRCVGQACSTSCAISDDCSAPAVCQAGQCVAPPAAASAGESSGCSSAPGVSTGSLGSVGAAACGGLALALVGALRRRNASREPRVAKPRARRRGA